MNKVLKNNIHYREEMHIQDDAADTLWYLLNWIDFYFAKLAIMDLDCDSLSNCFIIER